MTINRPRAAVCPCSPAPGLAQVTRVSVSTRRRRGQRPERAAVDQRQRTLRRVRVAGHQPRRRRHERRCRHLPARSGHRRRRHLRRGRRRRHDPRQPRPELGAARRGQQRIGPSISADGRYVAFVSTATNLVAGANGLPQVYRVDRTTATIVRVSESAAGDAGDADSGAPAISADGDVVAFHVAGDEPRDGCAQRRAGRSSCGRRGRSHHADSALAQVPRSPPRRTRLRLAVDLRRRRPGRLPEHATSVRGRSAAACVFDRDDRRRRIDDGALGDARSLRLSASGLAGRRRVHDDAGGASRRRTLAQTRRR